MRRVALALLVSWALARSVNPLGAQGPSPASPPDSTFHLATNDPARSPSPFIGNGRIGVVIPALGIGASNSFVAGLYEHAPSDVPRIVGRARLERRRHLRW